MRTLNFGLQCIGLMRQEMDSAFEAEVKKYSSLALLCDVARRVVDFKIAALDNIAHVKSLLVMLFRAQRKEILYVFSSSEDDLDLMWSEVQKFDSTLLKKVSYQEVPTLLLSSPLLFSD